MKKKIRNQKYQGFSFIESVIATFIILVGMMAVLQLMSKNIKNTFGNRKQTKAVFLAQEGVELIRNIRDNNWAQNNKDSSHTFDSPFPSTSETNCRIDVASPSSVSCSNSSFLLKYDSGSKIYNYNSGLDTSFRRKIEIKYLKIDGSLASDSTAADEAEISSAVIWGRNTFPVPCVVSQQCVLEKVTLTKWVLN